MKTRAHVASLPAMLLMTVMMFARTIPADAAGVAGKAAPADWSARVSQTTLTASEPLTLVARTAKDCKYCKLWEAPTGGKYQFEAWAAAHPDDRLVIVDRSAIASKEVAADYPDSLRWMFDQNRRHGQLQPLTPTFEIYAGKQLLWRSSGLPSWDHGVFPAIKDLDTRRQAKSLQG